MWEGARLFRDAMSRASPAGTAVAEAVGPFISAIIATRNRASLLGQTLDALVAQTWPRQQLEIIVADNGSSDNTRELIEANGRRPDAPSIRYLYVAEAGKSNAVNAALRLARGEL